MAKAKKPGTTSSDAKTASEAPAATTKPEGEKSVPTGREDVAKPTTLKEPAGPAASVVRPAEPAASATTKAAAASEAGKTTSSAGKIADPGGATPSPNPAVADNGSEKSDGDTPHAAAPAGNDANAADRPTGAAPVVHPATTDTTPSRPGSIFWPLLLGGVVAGAIGFFVAELNMLGTDGPSTVETDLRSALDDQQARIATLESAEDPAVAPDLSGIEEQLTALSAALEEVQSGLAGMDGRITALEDRPTTESGMTEAEIAAYEDELTALKTSVETQRSEIEGLLENAMTVEEAAAESARAATVQAALAKLRSAIDSGKPFSPAVEELQLSGVEDLPEPITSTAESGVVTMSNLQERFPEAARESLAAARRADGAESGFGDFLKRQLGARSVTPREGTDPDAVLSRAEADVRDGRLTDALAELDTLPEDAKATMDAWLADARAREAAEAAVDAVSQRLTAN